jgi:hypothetical protein
VPEGYENRLVLDEDVPPSLAESLRQRGFDAVALNVLRELIYARSGREGGSIGDDQVCDEVARVPSVLRGVRCCAMTDRGVSLQVGRGRSRVGRLPV